MPSSPKLSNIKDAGTSSFLRSQVQFGSARVDVVLCTSANFSLIKGFQPRHTPERSQDIFHIMQQSPFVSLVQGTEIATLQKLHCFMKHSSPSLAGHIQIQSNYDIPWLYQFLVNKAWLNAYFLLHFWWFLLKGRDMLHSCGSLAKPMGTSKRKLKIEQSASPNFYWSAFYKWPWIACTFMYTFNHLCIYYALMIDRNTLLHTKQTHHICIIMTMHTKKLT